MSLATISFFSQLLGAFISGAIGIFAGFGIFWFKRRQDGKDAFLLVTADQKAKLAVTNKGKLDEFYQLSIPIMSQAVYRALQFLNNNQRRALVAVWNEYQSQGKNLFGSREEFVNVAIESMVEGNLGTPWKRLEDFFEKFDECIQTRKPNPISNKN
jgi:hypothetical protein